MRVNHMDTHRNGALAISNIQQQTITIYGGQHQFKRLSDRILSTEYVVYMTWLKYSGGSIAILSIATSIAD